MSPDPAVPPDVEASPAHHRVLPLRPGSEGEAVRDVQQRLIRAGFNPAPDPAGTYGLGTEAAVRRFQSSRHLRVDGICGRDTWEALSEASWRLGDRQLYQRTPMLRGDDVASLQLQLSHLGFDAGRVDGIFGPETAKALEDFQRNAGLTIDAICGPAVVAALERMATRGGTTTKVGVRERDALMHAPRQLAQRRVVIAQGGELPALAAALGRALRALGAEALICNHPDESAQAAEANGFGAEVFVALAASADPGCRTSYWSTTGYDSVGGRRLAEFIADELASRLGFEPVVTQGLRLTVLRETRMPAVFCELGPVSALVEQTGPVARVLRDAITRWVAEPVEG